MVRTDLKIMSGMIKENCEPIDNNVCIMRWVVWLDKYDFAIEHKPGYLNCVEDLRTCEAVDLQHKEEVVVGM